MSPYIREIDSLFGEAEGLQTRIDGILTEPFLDAEELIVFGNPFSPVRSAGLDLASVEGDDERGDGGILGFARTVGDDGGPARVLGHLDGVDSLGQGADLVELDEDRVSDAHLDALGDDLGIGNEEVIADELQLLAKLLG